MNVGLFDLQTIKLQKNNGEITKVKNNNNNKP